MKIGIDGLPFTKNAAGIGKYMLSIIESMMDSLPHAEFVFFSNKDIVLPDYVKRRSRIVVDSGLYSKVRPGGWLKLFAWRLLIREKIDVYFSSAGLFPVIPKRIKKMVIVHDFVYKIQPQAMGRLQRLSYVLFFRMDVRHSDFIICNSKGTSDKMEQYWGLQPDIVINPPIHKRFFEIDKGRLPSILEKYGLRGHYLFSVGNLEPRKNLPMVIRSFANLVKSGKLSGYKLVMAGAKGWRDKEILRLCEEYKDFILRLGYVDDEDLPYLYLGTKAFLFPSLYEGFGIPAREAIICGCDVITSDIPELREASFDLAVYINPTDEKEFEKALIAEVQNPKIQDQKPIPVDFESNPAGLINYLKNIEQG